MVTPITVEHNFSRIIPLLPCCCLSRAHPVWDRAAGNGERLRHQNAARDCTVPASPESRTPAVARTPSTSGSPASPTAHPRGAHCTSPTSPCNRRLSKAWHSSTRVARIGWMIDRRGATESRGETLRPRHGPRGNRAILGHACQLLLRLEDPKTRSRPCAWRAFLG